MVDGSYLMVGKSGQSGVSSMLVAKLDPSFNINWSKTYAGRQGADAKDVSLMTNGNILVTGQDNNGESTLILELDQDGDPITSFEFGTVDDRLRNITKASDGGLLVYGALEGEVPGRNKLSLLYYEPDLSTVRWAKYYDNTSSSDNLANYEVHGRNLIATNDQGFLFLGNYAPISPVTERRVRILKIDKDGVPQWVKGFHGGKTDNGSHVAPTNDNGFVICITSDSYSSDGSNDVALAKLDNLGNVEWIRNYQAIGVQNITFVVQSPDGGYLVAGSTTGFGFGGSDGFLLKTDSNGNEQWARAYGNPNDEFFLKVDVLSDGYLLSGYTNSFDPSNDIYLVKTDVMGWVTDDCTFDASSLVSSTSESATFFDENYTEGSFNIPTPFSVSISNVTLDENKVCQGCQNVGLVVDTVVCTGSPMTLEASITGDTYLWSDGSSDSNLNVTNPGLYWVETTQATCTVRDTINVFDGNVLTLTFPESVVACEGDTVVLDAYNPGASYLWSDNSSQSTLKIVADGTYSVQIGNDCGGMLSKASTITFNETCDCDIYFPNAFTPNGDGLNDEFRAVLGCQIEYYDLSIFNRWGELIFKSNDDSSGWNGSYKGKQSPTGQYVYKATYKVLGNASPVLKQGGVYLMD